MGWRANELEKYIVEMDRNIRLKEDCFSMDPSIYDFVTINELVRWCYDQIRDLNESANNINVWIDEISQKMRADNWASDEEYNDALIDSKAIKWAEQEFPGLFERLQRLLNKFSGYTRQI